MINKIRGSLKAKLFLIFFISNLAVILMVGVTSYYSKKSALREQIQDSLSTMATGLADKIDRYLNERLDNTRELALHYSLHGLKSTTSNQNRLLARYLKIYPFYEQINIINVEDVQIPARGVRGANAWYLPALEGEVISSDIYLSPLTDRPTMSFAAPVTDDKGKVVSILTTNLSVAYLWDILDLIQKENAKKGLSGYAFLVNKNGVFIGHPKREKVLTEKASDTSDPKMVAMIKDMAAGDSGYASYAYEGVDKVAAYAPCRGFEDFYGHGWSVAVTMPYSELFAPMKDLLKVYLLIFLLTSLATLLLSTYVANYLVRPILALKEGAARIGRGSFNLRIDTKATDEIGSLAGSFNNMAETLQARDIQITEYTSTLTRINEQLAVHQEELRNANRHLKKTNDELVRLEKQKGEFMAMITHDIKSPLSTIITYSEMVTDGTIAPGSEDVMKAASSIYASGHKILSLVDNFMLSSAIEAGEFRLNLFPLDLNSFVDDELPFFMPQIEKKRIRLNISKGRGLPPVMADRVQLDRAFSNIMTNAIKFTPTDAEIAVSTAAVDSGVEISVADTGGGISEDELMGLFDKYRRAKDSARIEGMGLGLFISKTIAEAHGGKLVVRSKLGEGSVFSIQLPVKKD